MESSLLKYIASPNTGVSGARIIHHLDHVAAGMAFPQAVASFNANIRYEGLVHAVTEEGWFKENKDKLIMSALTALLQQGLYACTAICMHTHTCPLLR